MSQLKAHSKEMRRDESAGREGTIRSREGVEANRSSGEYRGRVVEIPCDVVVEVVAGTTRHAVVTVVRLR